MKRDFARRGGSFELRDLVLEILDPSLQRRDRGDEFEAVFAIQLLVRVDERPQPDESAASVFVALLWHLTSSA